MTSKQKTTIKNPKDNSAAEKRLLKWIATANKSSGAVTYTQVKTFLDIKQERSLKSCDTKLILTNLVEKGCLVKVGYKYLVEVPTTSQKKQAKKYIGVVPTVKRSAVDFPKPPRKVAKSVPVTKLKRSPGILNVPDSTNIQNSTIEGTEDVSNNKVPRNCTDAATCTTVTEDKDAKVIKSAGTLDVHDAITAENPTMDGTEDVSNGEVPRKSMENPINEGTVDVSDVERPSHSQSMNVATDTTKSEDSAVKEK